MLNRVAIVLGGLALAMALSACASGESPRAGAPTITVAARPAPDLTAPSLADYCGRVALAAYRQRLSTGTASPMLGAEAALDAREAARACVARGLGGLAPGAPPGRRHDPG